MLSRPRTYSISVTPISKAPISTFISSSRLQAQAFRTLIIRRANMSQTSLPSIDAKSQLSRAAYDFRSDTVTTPTPAMLQSMITGSLGDAVYDEDEITTAFECHIGKLLGHEAGLFVPSGTAGNQIALRVHLTQPPHSVLCDARSHIATAEAGGMATLSQAMVQPVRPKNGIYLTLEDVKSAAVLKEDIHYAPTRVVGLENTLGGSIMPLDEVKRITAWARENKLKLHLDGARLWNVAAAGAGSLSDFASLFDSVSVCFSKGLGAPVGSVLVGSEPFIKKAKWIRKSIGGGMRQTGILTAAAWTALDEVFPKLPETHAKAKDLEEFFSTLGLKTLLPVQTNMVFVDFDGAGIQGSWVGEEAAKLGVKTSGGYRFAIHHQTVPEAVAKLKQAVETVVQKKNRGEYENATNAGNVYGDMKRSL